MWLVINRHIVIFHESLYSQGFLSYVIDANPSLHITLAMWKNAHDLHNKCQIFEVKLIKIVLIFILIMESVTYPDIFGGDRFQQGVWEGGCSVPLWVQGKAQVGTRWQNSRKLHGFSTLNHLLLIKIYPSQPVMKLIQRIFFFFSEILRKFEFQVNFSVQSYAYLTCEHLAYLQLLITMYTT